MEKSIVPPFSTNLPIYTFDSNVVVIFQWEQGPQIKFRTPMQSYQDTFAPRLKRTYRVCYCYWPNHHNFWFTPKTVFINNYPSCLILSHTWILMRSRLCQKINPFWKYVSKMPHQKDDPCLNGHCLQCQYIWTLKMWYSKENIWCKLILRSKLNTFSWQLFLHDRYNWLAKKIFWYNISETLLRIRQHQFTPRTSSNDDIEQ